MDIESVGVALLVLLPLILLWDSLMGAAVWKANGWQAPTLVLSGAAARHARLAGVAVAASWLAVTVMTLWCECIVAFVALHLVLFAFGSAVALAALIATGGLLVATPIAWARVIRHHVRRA